MWLSCLRDSSSRRRSSGLKNDHPAYHADAERAVRSSQQRSWSDGWKLENSMISNQNKNTMRRWYPSQFPITR